jgi:hypothetical protein
MPCLYGKKHQTTASFYRPKGNNDEVFAGKATAYP